MMEMDLTSPSGEMGTLDAMIAALTAAAADAEFSAAADAGELTLTVEENGDITLRAGEVSKTISAATLLGEDESEDEAAAEMPEASE